MEINHAIGQVIGFGISALTRSSFYAVITVWRVKYMN